MLAKVVLFKEYFAQLAQTLLEWIIHDQVWKQAEAGKAQKDNEYSIRNGDGHELSTILEG